MDLKEKNYLNNNRHPWEVARADSILKIFLNKKENLQFADVGAGDLFFANKLKLFSSNPILAVDSNFIKKESNKSIICFDEISEIESEKIDFVFLLDVLEHIEEESNFLESLNKILKKSGKLVVTVPAHNSLFSLHDKFLNHFRRYNNKQLNKVIESNGFNNRTSFYFFTIPLFIRIFQIFFIKLGLVSKMENGIGNWQFENESIFTRFLTFILKLDFKLNHLLNKVFGFSLGLSLCALYQKK